MSTVTIVGLGNIGSALVPMVTRMPSISAITLVDPDTYSTENLRTQAIDVTACGKPKVQVQAAAIRSINPGIDVRGIEDRVENVPLTVFGGSAVLACVDNRNARQTINRNAWRCGRPWVDAAVGAPSLVRVGVWSPKAASPCLECGWDAQSYEMLEQRYACDPASSPVSPAATNAPAELGALAASLQAVLVRRLLQGDPDEASPAGQQLVYDTRTNEQHTSRFRYNDCCRFDHEVWELQSLPLDVAALTLEELFDATGAGPDQSLGVEGQSFCTSLNCIVCGRRYGIGLTMPARLDADLRRCRCGGQLFAAGFSCLDVLQKSELPPESLQTRLQALGICSGDVVSLLAQAGEARHYQLGGVASHD